MTDADLDAIYSAPNGAMWHVAAHRAYKLAASRLTALKPGEVVVRRDELESALNDVHILGACVDLVQSLAARAQATTPEGGAA